jgi:peptide chain release factor
MCRSPLRPGHARKNWFIGVIALPPCRAASPLTLSDLRFESFRAGGPGGQHQNKTESAVRVVHVPTGLAAVARDGRSQHRNKALAIARLQALLEGRTLLAESRDASLVHTAHHTVARGSGGLRFEGPQFRPIGMTRAGA